MPDEEIITAQITQAHLSGPEAALDRVLIDQQVAKADLRVANQMRPAATGVGDRLAQIARGGSGCLKPEQQGFGKRSANAVVAVKYYLAVPI
jgi:hypothetical protein